MGEFKRDEHAKWDPDQEIQTWKDREAVLAKGDEEESDEEEDESTPMAGSPKQAKREARTEEIVDVGLRSPLIP